jgi:F0F1-type ATP synthase membrane subunit b/b'
MVWAIGAIAVGFVVLWYFIFKAIKEGKLTEERVGQVLTILNGGVKISGEVMKMLDKEPDKVSTSERIQLYTEKAVGAMENRYNKAKEKIKAMESMTDAEKEVAIEELNNEAKEEAMAMVKDQADTDKIEVSDSQWRMIEGFIDLTLFLIKTGEQFISSKSKEQAA